MRNFKCCFLAFIIALLFAAEAPAQVARVFLSGTGNDTNDCTNAATPCRSLQGAVNQCPVNGEIMIMTSGGYGTVTISKSLTINAPAGVVAFNARTITVAIAAGDKVVIRGLSMNGTVFADPNGIDFSNSAGTLVVENSIIAGFNTGINQGSLAGNLLVVQNCELRNNSGYGVVAFGNVYLNVENSRFEKNTVGVSVEGGANAVIRNSVVTGYARSGFGFEVAAVNGKTSNLVIDKCLASNLDTGVRTVQDLQSTASAQVTNSSITMNSNGLSTSAGGTIVSYLTNQLWNNTVDGSFSSTTTQN
ncbi:MAG: hypothetical protein DMF57_00865 [Acidobacteria bacterium]|nr:MAG: hypothetical protein DMF57_00865 [Acidobacteriota bacterium]